MAGSAPTGLLDRVAATEGQGDQAVQGVTSSGLGEAPPRNKS
jgi:valyl-tRNA synthetase